MYLGVLGSSPRVRAIHRIRTDDDVFPDPIQQLLDADYLARALRETHQEPHCLWLEFDCVSGLANLVQRRIYAQVGDPQRGKTG